MVGKGRVAVRGVRQGWLRLALLGYGLVWLCRVEQGWQGRVGLGNVGRGRVGQGTVESGKVGQDRIGWVGQDRVVLNSVGVDELAWTLHISPHLRFIPYMRITMQGKDLRRYNCPYKIRLISFTKDKHSHNNSLHKETYARFQGRVQLAYISLQKLASSGFHISMSFKQILAKPHTHTKLSMII